MEDIHVRNKILLALVCVLVFSLAAVVAAQAQSGSGFDLHWNVIGGGGGTSTGSGFSVTGTIGQTAVGASSGSNFELSHGFWQQVIGFLRNMLPLTVKH
jgi:hypothetical protein